MQFTTPGSSKIEYSETHFLFNFVTIHNDKMSYVKLFFSTLFVCFLP